MKFRPETLGDRVILKPFILGKKSEGGIILASNTRIQATNSDRGEIYMIGPEAWSHFKKQPVKVGDKVFYSKYGAKVIKDPATEDEDDFFILCNDVDILVGYK